MKASPTCAVQSRWRHCAHRHHELLIVWCRVFDSPQTHLQPDVRWSDINREAENKITSYSANQKTFFPPRFYFGAAKLLLGESRPDFMRRQPFLISSGIVAACSKWIDDPITTRCLQSAARSAPRWQATWQRSPLTFRVNSWKRMTFATWLQIPLPIAPCIAAEAQGGDAAGPSRTGPGWAGLVYWFIITGCQWSRVRFLEVTSIFIISCFGNSRGSVQNDTVFGASLADIHQYNAHI